MEGNLVWTVMTEMVDGKPNITLVHCWEKGGDRYEAFEIGDVVRTRRENVIAKIPAGTEGKVSHLADPIRYRYFVYVEFGEGTGRKLGTFTLSELENLTHELASRQPVTVA